MSAAGAAKSEAREWLKDPAHVFFKADRKTVSQFDEDFYAVGVAQVLFVDLESHAGKEFSGRC